METDVIIVGAGPAGATLAYLLAKNGHHVVLIEKEESLDREFRGPAYQPSVIRLWDEMGILSDILRCDHHSVEHFTVYQDGKALLSMDLRFLPKPYQSMVLMQQGPLLRLMIKLAAQFENFTYIGASSVTDLLKKDEQIIGVRTHTRDSPLDITAPITVAADGRFSTIRKLANISLEHQKQAMDIVWFETPLFANATLDAGIRLLENGMIIFLPKEHDLVQIGWLIPKGFYQTLLQKGIEYIKKETIRALPEGKTTIEKTLTSMDQCHLLDIMIANSKQWEKEGLLLIGDAAHIASPVGAQGNKLAIEDAVIASQLITKIFKSDEPTFTQEKLQWFSHNRSKDIRKILLLQKRVGNIMLKPKTKWTQMLRKTAMQCIAQTPLLKHFVKLLALSPRAVHLHAEKKTAPDQGIFQLAYVKEIYNETEDAISIVFEPKIPFETPPIPGQFLTFRFLIHGELYRRCYSLSSCQPYRITVKKIKKGIVSDFIHQHLTPDSTLLISKPDGQFIADKISPHTPLACFAAGSGITPIFALIQNRLQQKMQATIALYYFNHSEKSVIFLKALQQMQKEHPSFQLNLWMTESEGRPTKETLSQLPLPKEAHFFICGPEPLKQTIVNTLIEKNIALNTIHIEQFASLKENHELHFPHPKISPTILGEKTNNDPPHSIVISIDNKQKTIPYEQKDTLLDAALKQNLNPPYSCKQGICRSCMAQLINGSVEMQNSSSLTPQEIKKNMLLTCQAKALCDRCEIKYS